MLLTLSCKCFISSSRHNFINWIYKIHKRYICNVLVQCTYNMYMYTIALDSLELSCRGRPSYTVMCRGYTHNRMVWFQVVQYSYRTQKFENITWKCCFFTWRMASENFACIPKPAKRNLLFYIFKGCAWNTIFFLVCLKASNEEQLKK